ncbi:hypothetical protein GDO81_019688 [Engystomops pustulosus]|uniref:Uncharacterized protein n=1 Tax=Engystomops pustulosus TaxID=76066 RepID=A0AAV6ZD43_ENGPU|nr:hypothetical protein GDO81_019688 [Engystomops pustulosus]
MSTRSGLLQYVLEDQPGTFILQKVGLSGSSGLGTCISCPPGHVWTSQEEVGLVGNPPPPPGRPWRTIFGWVMGDSWMLYPTYQGQQGEYATRNLKKKSSDP